MRLPLYRLATVVWLLTMAASGSARADEPAAKPAEKKVKLKVRIASDDVVESLDLEAVAAPLRALFGGGIRVEPMQAQLVEAPVAEEVNAQDDAMTQQFLQQLRPIMIAELGFVRLICSELTTEQRPKIRVAAEAGLKQAAKKMAQQQNRQNRGGAIQANTRQEPRNAIRDGIAKALKETLTEEQLALYTDEATKRTGQRKQAAILSLVSRLDGQLCLTAEQREKITNSISSKWQDGWEKWSLMMSTYGDRYFPVVPDQYVVPHLNAEQKSVWDGLQKVDFGWWGGQGGPALENDGWWGLEQAAEDAPFNGAGVGFF